jgi:hypothetical protein
VVSDSGRAEFGSRNVRSGAGLVVKDVRYRENREDGPGPAIAFVVAGESVPERTGTIDQHRKG